MGRLERTYHQLEKAQKKFEKYSKTEKQFQLQFKRQQNRCGNFRTKINIVRGEKNYKYQHKGLLHRLVNQKSRIVGDVPSVTKALKSIKPKTIRGHIAKKAAQAVNFAVHDVVQTAVDIGLGAETVGMKIADSGAKNIKNKYIQKYRQEALDDYHKGVIKLGTTSVDAVKGTFNHFKVKKQFKVEKARYRLKKAEYKLFKLQDYHQLSDIQNKTCSKKWKYREIKNNFKAFDRQRRVVTSEDRFNRNVRKFRYKKRSKQLKTEIKQNKNKIKQLKSEKKFRKKELKNQWRIADLYRPAPIALKPVSYTSKQMAASKWQKAVYEDESNDFMKVTDEIKRHGVDKAVQKMSYHNLKEKNHKKKQKLDASNKKKKHKLKKQEYKLKDKQSDLHNYKKRRNNQKPNMLMNFLKHLKNMAQDDAKKFLLCMLVPVIILLLVIEFITIIFSGIANSSGFILGTYTAQDYDLSKAEKYYTKLAWDMNENVKLVGDYYNWKTGLQRFGVNTSGMKDTPDTWCWNDSLYDFDVYKLWSFLCAYYYDFDSTEDDLKYWKFTSDTENLLKEIFEAEYEFVSTYDNTSHWEYKYCFDHCGYYSVDNAGVSGSYGYLEISYPDALPMPWVADGKILYYDLSNGEVLNANDGYSSTGWYLKNQYINDYDNSGNVFGAWYTNGEQCSYGIWDNGVLVTPIPYVIPEQSWCSFLKKYDWKTDCRLYYSVKQKKTFDEIIADKLKSLSHKEERLQYYGLLLGIDSEQMYGNHQTLKNIFDLSIHNYSRFNGFGYDMQKWNETHCEINNFYEGIDVVVNYNANLYAPFDCKIASVDSSSIVLKKNDVKYWYDGTGGTKRDTEVYLSNVGLKSGLSVGDTLKAGEHFANSTKDYVNIKVKTDTDGYGWNFIDPYLVLY